MEDSSDSTGNDDYLAPITEWTRSDEAPPGWRTKTLPLTPDATIKAVHEALEKVAQKIDPASSVNKLTVLRSRHILASILTNMPEEESFYTTSYTKSASMKTLKT